MVLSNDHRTEVRTDRRRYCQRSGGGACRVAFLFRPSVARYRAELVRKGEKLKISEVLPKPVAAESNGAPALKMGAAQLPRSTPAISAAPAIAMRLFAPGRAAVGWQQPDLRTRSE